MNESIQHLRTLLSTELSEESFVKAVGLLRDIEQHLKGPLQVLRDKWESPKDLLIGEFHPNPDTLIVVRIGKDDTYYVRRYWKTALSWDVSADLDYASPQDLIEYLLEHLQKANQNE